ncbi:uncharacterized protein trim33l isoform X2 [Sebastes fasciatus]|uniref:uncharacterized protein trim33l isoform X2 n=1 Tax=Sebastes fasciatus TaxID=394691 RepID=UPI003D9F984E
MTSLFNMEAAANVSQQCCSCDASSARCWCVDCNEALCDICVSAHRRVTVTRSHRILNQPPAGGVSTPPTKFCRLHPSEPLKLYCFTCNQLTCRDCQLTAHMNHRYQFVREALHTLKKQLEVRVQPIRAQGDRVSRILLDMETRLQDIANSQSCLKTELQQSYTVLIQHLKMRMVEILKQVEKVCESEYEWIQRRMRRMKQLMQKQQAVTEIAEKARNTSDLSALWTYTTQVESQLKNLPDEDLSPPQTMSELKVVTDHSSLDAVVNFGALQVLWVPFAVSQTSNQNTPAGFSSYPSTPACPDPTYRPLPQTRTTRDSPVPVGSSSTSSSQLCPLSFTVTPTTSTCPAPSRRTDSPAPVTCPSTSWKSSLSFNQSNAPFATTAAVTSAVQHPSSTLSQLEKNSPGQVPQPFSAPLPPSAGPSSVLQPVQPSLVLNQPTAPHKNQSTAALLNITQTVYQVSCLPPAVPQFPMLLSQASPGNTWPKQKYLMGNVIPGRLSPASVSSKIPPAATTGNQISVGPSQTALHPPPTSSPPSSTQRLDPDTDPGPHSSSLDQQQQSPVVRAVADSACDCSVQQAAARQPEPAENEPTSTVSEEPAGKPSAPEEPEPEPEVLDKEVEEPEPEVSDSEGGEPEPEPQVSDKEVEEPEPEVSDRDVEKPEPEVLDSEGDKLEPEPLVSDSGGDEPELLVSDSEGDELEPELLVSDSEGDELEPELLVSDSEGDELEPELLVSDSEGDELEPESLVSDSGGDEPELLVSDSEGDELEPESLVSDSEGDELEPESLVSDSEGDEPEPKPEVSDSESDELEPGVSDSESDELEPGVSDSEGDELEPGVSDSEGDELEPGVSDSEGDELEPGVSDSECDELEPGVSDSECDGLEPGVSDSECDGLEPGVSDSECDGLEPGVSDSECDELQPGVSDSECDGLEPGVSDSECDGLQPGVSDSEGDEPGLVIGESVSSLSQWQPSVVLLRLPVSSPRPGCPLPCFSLVAGDDEDEFYLKEIQDTQSHAGDVTDDTITELPSPPSSPATLVIVTCSACRSANSSIICSFCGRGYHRDCHLPPVGPDLRSEWMCSLCQDLSDPSDPFSSDRPPRPHSPCLSLQDQRRCESLLLYVKVEGCPRLPQCQLTVMSERLTLCRSPSYRTAAEFLSDIWSLFKDASEDDDVLMRLQESLRCRWIGGLGPELRNTDGGKHAVKQPFTSDMSDAEQAAEHFKGSKVKMEEEEVAVTSESKMKETRKRLRALLHLVELARSKRAKTDKMAERQNP